MSRLIKTTFTIVTEESAQDGDFAESGYLDEDGVSMEPDEFDIEEGLSCVDLAVKFLKGNGVISASSSRFHVGTWYSSEDDTDMRSGDCETHSYHLEGFSPEEEEAIFNLVGV